jgi:hypothetical protein
MLLLLCRCVTDIWIKMSSIFWQGGEKRRPAQKP